MCSTVEVEASLTFERLSGGSQTLNRKQMRCLLTEVTTDHRRVEDDELHWVLRLADRDSDEQLTREEALVVVQCWIGYIMVESAYGSVFEQFFAESERDAAALRDALVEVNDKEPVLLSTAEGVLDTARMLSDGATPSRTEVIAATGVWYLSVARVPTPAHRQVLDSMTYALKAKAKLVPSSSGQASLGSALTASVTLLFRSVQVVAVVLAALKLYAAYRFWPAPCPRHLAGILVATGTLILVSCWTTNASHYVHLVGYSTLATSLAVVSLAGDVANMSVVVYGITMLAGASPEDRGHCGHDLCHWFWWLIMFPLILTCVLLALVVVQFVLHFWEGRRLAQKSADAETTPLLSRGV